MKHPEWILQHKIPNLEIRYIRNRYYLYAITSIWCPEKKHTKTNLCTRQKSFHFSMLS